MRHWFVRLLLGCLMALSLPVGIPAGVTSAAETWDFSNDAWAYLRAKTPAARNVYRPTWLPDRFWQPAVASTYDSGLVFGATYVSDTGDRLLFGSTANFCGGCERATVEPITVRGYPGTLTTAASPGPETWFSWLEGEQAYMVLGYRANAASQPSRDEMLRIAASLEPVGPDGRPVTPDGPPTEECFAETTFCITGRFLDRWRASGGARINGFPLSGEFAATLEDGKTYTVQYFERVRLEHHPENPAPFDVLLGQFGRRLYEADPPVGPAQNTPQYFPETGHNLSGQFYTFWREYGLAQFGYPLSEEITETLEDGKTYQVQYFERARLEYHPENPYPYQILIGQFGRRILDESTSGTITASTP